MKRWRFELTIVALLVATVAVSLAYSFSSGDPDVADVVDAAPEGSITFRVDLESAFGDAGPVDVGNGWREISVPAEDVVSGDPQYVLAARTDAEQKNLRVLFLGHWPMSDDYPIVLSDEGMLIRSSSGASRRGPAALRVSFAGDVDSVGTVTFILGECAGASYLETIKAICDVRRAQN